MRYDYGYRVTLKTEDGSVEKVFQCPTCIEERSVIEGPELDGGGWR